MSRSQDMIAVIQLDYGLPDRAIAAWCGVERDHINKVKMGKRRAGPELEKSLEALLAECDRHGVQLSRKAYQWKAGEDVRPKKKPVRLARSSPATLTPRVPTRHPLAKHTPIESPARVSGPATRQPPSSPRPTTPPGTPRAPAQSPTTPRMASSTCLSCQRPGTPTKRYQGVWLCQWCALARGYSVKTPAPTFLPLDAQHSPVERVTDHEDVNQAEDLPPDPRAWEPLQTRELWAYNSGKLCLACRAHTSTRQVRMAQPVQGKRSVRLCEACCARYGV